MKLEEVLPAYREGKAIVSPRGLKCQKDKKNGWCRLDCINEEALLGEWTILEEPKPPRKMSPALCKERGRFFLSDHVFDNENEPRGLFESRFVSWPALDGNGNPIVVLVPEVGK